jgi:ABC-type sugar transport system ATPase subunit
MNLVPGKYSDGIVHMAVENKYNFPDQWKNSLENNLSGDGVLVGFRPEAAEVTETGEIRTEVYADDLEGSHTMLHLALEGDESDSIVHIRARRGLGLEMGAKVNFSINPEMVRFFDQENETTIAQEA